MSIIFTPFQIYNGVKPTFGAIIILLLISFIFIFPIGWIGLLKTNNPITRYNPFSLNPKFKNKMDHSISDDPSGFFTLDEADELEIKKIKRNKALNKILD